MSVEAKMGVCAGFLVFIIGIVVVLSIIGGPSATHASSWNKNEPIILPAFEAGTIPDRCLSIFGGYRASYDCR